MFVHNFKKANYFFTNNVLFKHVSYISAILHHEQCFGQWKQKSWFKLLISNRSIKISNIFPQNYFDLYNKVLYNNISDLTIFLTTWKHHISLQNIFKRIHRTQCQRNIKIIYTTSLPFLLKNKFQKFKRNIQIIALS